MANTHMISKETALLSAGFGAYAALAIGFLHRWGFASLTSGSQKTMVLWSLLGLGFAGLPVALLASRGHFNAKALSSSLPRSLFSPALILGVVSGSMTCWGPLASTSADSVLIPTGIVFGAGMFISGLVLSGIHGCFRATTMLPALGIGLLLAAALDIIAQAIPDKFGFLACLLDLAIAIATTLPHHHGDAPTELASALGTARRFRDVALTSIKPVAGAVICLYVFGLTWDVQALGVQLNDPGLVAVEKVVGLVLAGIVMLIVWHLKNRIDVTTVLLDVVLPVMVVAFVVRPYFLGTFMDTATLLLVGVARETGFTLFICLSWLVLSNQSRLCDVHPGIPFGVFFALLGSAGALGMAALPVMSGTSQYIGAILFTCYLVLTSVTAALERAHVQHQASISPAPAQAAEEIDMDAFVNARCSELGERYGFTVRERDVAWYLGRGHSYAYIANALTVSENTVRTHIRNMYRKAGISSREELLDLVHKG